MTSETRSPASREGRDFRNASLPLSVSDNSENLTQVQLRYLAARYGLAVDRARLIAGLHFGEALR